MLSLLPRRAFIAAAIAASAFGSVAATPVATGSGQPTVVLVHGAFADGSSWNRVIEPLLARGLKVVAVQNPLTSLADDVAATRRVLDQQTGPVVLVGHSWGGIVITEAGRHERVQALVYVASFAPDVGQSIADLTRDHPRPSGLDHVVADKEGFLTMSAQGMAKHFAQDLPAAETRLMFVTQGPIQAKNFEEKVTVAAWKTKPSWFIVTEQDRMILPALQATWARGISAKLVRLQAGHAPQASKPAEVARTILEATAAVSAGAEQAAAGAPLSPRP